MSLVGLATAIAEGPHGRTQKMIVRGVDEDGFESIEHMAVQFWPETVSISASVNYADKAVIGGSHPIRQWTGGSGRSMSLSFMVGRDMKRQADMPGFSALNRSGLSVLVEDPQSAENAEWNFDVRQQIDRFTAFTLPTYSTDGVGGTDVIAKPPPTIILSAPGMAWSINPDARDDFMGVVKSVNVTYKRLFTESGIVRLATIDIQVDESVQYPLYGVKFVGIDAFKASPWWKVRDA